MNRGMLNGSTLNGTAPSWLTLATATATAAAVLITAVATRIPSGGAAGTASATATVRAAQIFSGSAAGAGGANFALAPTLILAGQSDATGSATGLAAVLRTVMANATADATAHGEAIPSSKLGTASADAASTVAECVGHLVRTGRSAVNGLANYATAAGDVTRYGRVDTTVKALALGRADQTVKLAGESFHRHDGYVPRAASAATATVVNGYTAIIAGIGSLDISSAISDSTAFITYSARALGQGMLSSSSEGLRTAAGTVNALAGTTATASATRVKLAVSSANATATHGIVTPRMNYKARVSVTAVATVAATGVRSRPASASVLAGATGTAQTADFHRATVTAQGAGSGSGQARIIYMAQATGDGAGTVRAAATHNKRALANGAGTATGTADGFANADAAAPIERRMTVQAENRLMVVEFEDRLMLAA